MEARILKSDGTLGKKIYEIDAPVFMHAIQKRLNKTLLGAGKWRNTNTSYFTAIFQKNGYNKFFSKETLIEILAWMESIKEKS